jgi:hypothetical protein
MSDKKRQAEGEHSDSEDEGGRRNTVNYKERTSLLSHDRGEEKMDVDGDEDGEADDEGI